MVATTKTIWWPGHRRTSPLFLLRPCLHVNARTGRVLGGGRWSKVETIVCHALSTPASCCLACPNGEGRREGKKGRGRGFLAGHERLSGSQWTKLSNNKVEATVCSASSSSSSFLIHSLSDSCASPTPAPALSLSPLWSLHVPVPVSLFLCRCSLF